MQDTSGPCGRKTLELINVNTELQSAWINLNAEINEAGWGWARPSSAKIEVHASTEWFYLAVIQLPLYDWCLRSVVFYLLSCSVKCNTQFSAFSFSFYKFQHQALDRGSPWSCSFVFTSKSQVNHSKTCLFFILFIVL